MVGRATPAQIKKALEHHGIGHMSASTCNSVINGGMAWFVAQKVYGVRDKFGVAAERGKAVEAAIMEYLMDRNLSVEHVIERAIEVFEAATQGAKPQQGPKPSPKKKKARSHSESSRKARSHRDCHHNFTNEAGCGILDSILRK